MADRDSGSSFIIGFLMGTIAGLAVGFLYAPKPGRETRGLLKEKAGEIAGRAEGLAGKAKETAEEVKKKVEGRLGSKEGSEA